jgi:hypothetical protein
MASRLERKKRRGKALRRASRLASTFLRVSSRAPAACMRKDVRPCRTYADLRLPARAACVLAQITWASMQS